MGMIWRAMPLLSTLAALVIIAHSAEEGFEDERIRERDYRYELRPRVLDTETPTYDQPWRAIEAEPMMQDTPEDHQPYDEPVRRRRPRKRKRRPLSASEETRDEKSEDKDIYHEERYREPKVPLTEEKDAYHEEITHRKPEVRITDADITEAPRRRRKRPNKDRPSRFTEEFFEFDRPVRRRNRRKRPSLDGGHRLSEFDIKLDEHTTEVHADSEYLRVDYHSDDRDHENIPVVDYHLNDKEYKDHEPYIPVEDYEHEDKKVDRPKVKSIPKRYFELSTEKTTIASSSETNYNDTEKLYIPLQEDKSLSEFSIEAEVNYDTEDINPKNVQQVSKLRDKLREKSKLINNADKALESGPIDPVALKEILKRSNGTSLSEILQEHNLSLSDLLRGKEDAISILKSQALDNKVANNTNINNASTPTPKTKDERKAKINIKRVIQILQNNKAKYDKKQTGTGSIENETMKPESEERLEVKENGPRLATKAKSVKKPETRSTENDTKLPESEERLETKENEPRLAIATKAKTVKNQPETRSTENDTKLPESEERLEAKENGPRLATIRRFPASMIPGNNRRKLRLRPSNTTMKNQLSRDLIAQTARKYLYHSGRNSTKGKDWKQVLPSMNLSLTQPAEEANTKIENTEIPVEIESTTHMQETITMPVEDDDNEEEDVQITTTEVNVEIDTSDEQEPNELETEESAASNTTVAITTTIEISTTEKPKKNERPKKERIRFNNNNRLKRNRLKHKSTTEAPEEDGLKDFLGLGNLVSSSELIARTQKPDTPLTQNNDEDFTSLDDFLTTPMSRRPDVKTTRITTMTYSSPRRNYIQSTTEETAKIEIEEILNDTRTSARLSKILMERNMTLNELVEHRERGSSHVHLADIFHNTSKEPNPPEPFLSKSSIEPISKETYPLRAILEANLHDSTAKATTLDPNLAAFIHIPVVMDFGNNVNENGDMGIMSLFNKITTESDESIENSDVKKDSEGTPYITTIISVNATDLKVNNESVREGKDVKETDVTGWNKLLELMRKHHENSTEDVVKTITTEENSSESTKSGIEDPDGEGLIVLEDLQRLDAFKSNIATSQENLEVNTYESDTTIQPGILDRPPSSTRSVTVATASIVGLAMILFLLTYGAFKWKQQRSLLRKKESFSEERIPTPVFESRKGHKNNCSTRSISPMLASNIYTMNTLDSRAGTESPEYMWDSLRKPFQ